MGFWDRREPAPEGPWLNSQNPPDRRAIIVRQWRLGRYGLHVTRQFLGDMYGMIGGDTVEWRFTFTRDPH